MKLLTKAIEKQISKYPFHSQEGRGIDAKVIVKFFNPCGSGTWLVIEGEKIDDGDYEFFGYVELGGGYEWGYFRLSELQQVRGRGHVVGYGSFTLPIERDIYARGTVRELI